MPISNRLALLQRPPMRRQQVTREWSMGLPVRLESSKDSSEIFKHCLESSKHLGPGCQLIIYSYRLFPPGSKVPDIFLKEALQICPFTCSGCQEIYVCYHAILLRSRAQSRVKKFFLLAGRKFMPVTFSIPVYKIAGLPSKSPANST